MMDATTMQGQLSIANLAVFGAISAAALWRRCADPGLTLRLQAAARPADHAPRSRSARGRRG